MGMSCSVASRSAFDDRRRLGIRRRLRESRDLEQLVDRRRFFLLLGEAVALGQRCHLLCIDSVHETVEMRTEAGVGPRAMRRLEQDVQGAVEFASGARSRCPTLSSRSPASKCCCDVLMRARDRIRRAQARP